MRGLAQREGRRHRALYVLSVLAFLVMLAAALRIVLAVFGPEAATTSPPPAYHYDSAPLQQAISPARVKSHQDEILGFGSRLMGQPGFYRTQAHIREAYEAAGLEVYEQTNWTVVPKTEYRELYLEEDGATQRIDDVEIYPFLPNHLQPMTTPDEGIAGELVLMTEEVLATRTSFEDCIALVDATEGAAPQTYGYDWSRYAQLGVKAVIVAHPEGLERVRWINVAAETGAMVTSVPVNYVRLAADAGIFDYAGQRIRLRVRTRFEETPNTTLVGILRAGSSSAEQSNDQALVVLTNYDAASILPDKAPGVIQAIPVATQLALVEGLAPYRDTLVRDVIFVSFGAQFMARDGDNNLLKLLDENIVRSQADPAKVFLGIDEDSEGADQGGVEDLSVARLIPWETRLEKSRRALDHTNESLRLLEDDGVLADAEQTEGALESLPEETADFFLEQVAFVLDRIVFDLNEELQTAKIEFLRAGEDNLETPEFAHYQQVKRRYDRAVTAAGYSPMNLLRSEEFGARFLKEYDLRALATARLEELREYHTNRNTHLSDSITLLKAFLPYRKLIVFDNKMVPAPEDGGAQEQLSFWDGDWGIKTNMREMASLLASSRQRLAEENPAIGDHARFTVPELSRWHSTDVDRNTRPVSNLSATEWTLFGYHMYTFLSFGRAESYRHYFDPVDLPFMHDVESLQYSTALYGELLLTVAHGNGRFSPIQLGWLKKHFGGRVLASGVGQSMVPNFPMSGAVLSGRPYYGSEYSYPGYYEHPLIMTDPYGRYELLNTPSDFWVNRYIWANGYSPLAASYGPDGLITWMKDEGETGQRLYKSVNLNWFDAKVDDVTLVMFRASPVSLLETTNPQKMSDFSGVRFFDSQGLSQLEKHCSIRVSPDAGMNVTFVEPDALFYIALESGSPENDLAKLIRGFMLNMPANWKPLIEQKDRSREIAGPGFRGADANVLSDVSLQIARSMAALNEDRLRIQQKHDMADAQVLDYHDKALSFLEQAEDPTRPKKTAVLDARDSVTYSMLNHPVLRASLTEAVIGILYYLALLVPFVFFFEKMVFGFTDIRKQLGAQLVIFLAVFLLLRLLHPAFSMIRSSLMILLGFAIILIAGSMTLLFSEKFKENLEELSKRRGHVSTAQVNRFGVITSAFMLGLNNMHRRKLRTALTCGTLTLMTFAVISFTSVQTSIVNEQQAIGKAPYQGILLKKELFKRFLSAEVFAIQAKYGDKFTVCPRKMSLGTQNWLDKQGYNPVVEIVYTNGGKTRKQRLNSIIQMNHLDPLQSQIEMTTNTPWFSEDDVRGVEGVPPAVILPSTVANALGMSSAEIEAGNVRAQINGRTFRILGTFAPESLAAARDLDNQTILPYDIENMSRIHTLEDGEVLADENSPRLPAEKVLLAPLTQLGIEIPNEKADSNCSIALYMPEGETRHVRAQIDSFLEQSEKPAYFGLNGIAYRGQRTRKSSISGLVDLLVPLLIVALTVLNTMKGSVYERQSEIGVYNAVGIAPRYVFFMFMAEALVYAVVGSLLGYLLSQGVGKLLIATNLTGGMKMTFTSITTIYASLAVSATALLSTWFPARTAMRIARPAEEAGWTLPEPQDDQLFFDLPFTFNYRDRLAVLAFCHRFLEEHGEGGSGSFYCLPPRATILEEGTEILPAMTTTAWLKPYDLGVSQTVVISMPFDPETGDFKARVALCVLTGSRDAWMRLNKRFVMELRRQFLHWRAVADADREQMYEEARECFEQIPAVES
ncbi:MAG: hypothetical protein PWP23_387 [Candidatus Sumerlaeota bacterium]|nr:hypothetical protein [Candidatus Sumerlaeota bacterium]